MGQINLDDLIAEANSVPSMPQLAHIFQNLRKPISSEEMAHLRIKLNETIEWLTQIGVRSDEFETELACTLCDYSQKLIEWYDTFKDHQKALICAAVQYFLFRNDAIPDTHSSDGLQDDRLVMNYVLLQLGMKESLIPARLQRSAEPATQGAPIPRREISEKSRRAWLAVRERLKDAQLRSK